MIRYNNAAYSKLKWRLIFILPLVPYVLFMLLSISSSIFKFQVSEEITNTMYTEVPVISWMIGYGFYIAFWGQKEKQKIANEKIEFLTENNAFLFNLLKECLYIHNHSKMPLKLKNDLFDIYLSTAKSIVRDTKDLLEFLSADSIDYSLPKYITDNDKETYNRIMNKACVTDDDCENTAYWDIIKRAIIISIHYSEYNDVLLSNYLDKKNIIDFENSLYYKNFGVVCRASSLMRILGYDDWEKFKLLINIAKEELVNEDAVYTIGDKDSDYELSYKACKKIIDMADGNKPEVKILKSLFDDNLKTIELKHL